MPVNIINFSKKIFMFFNKKKFLKKKKKIFLVLHSHGSDYLKMIFKKKNIEVVDYINEVNLYILFLILFKKKSLFNYLFYYIKVYDPKYIISCIDNNETLYLLKKFYKDKKFIFIQTGLRRKDHLQFKHKKKMLSADLNMVFGKNLHNIYKQKINTKVISIGSFKNNFYDISTNKDDGRIYFISQFRKNLDNDNIYPINGKFLTYGEWIRRDIELLKILNKFCIENKKKLYILSTYDKERAEYLFFKTYLKNNFNLLNRKSNSYNKLNSASIIITMDSTLGYEAIAQGKKVIFFSRLDNKEFYFKWPDIKKKKDFFYSNKINYNEFIKIYKTVNNLSHKNWENKIQNKIKDVIIYDKKNSILRKVFSNLGCDNNYFQN